MNQSPPPVPPTVAQAQVIAYASPLAGPIYAGFGERLGAWILDMLLLGVIRFALLAACGLIIEVISPGQEFTVYTLFLATLAGCYLIGWLYYAIMEASRLQATVGKLAVGIQVADIEDGPATFLQTSARFFTRLISIMTFGFGFLMIASTARHQALHDIGANCIVIHRKRQLPSPGGPRAV